MMPDASTIWLLIAGMTVITFALRASFLLLPESVVKNAPTWAALLAAGQTHG